MDANLSGGMGYCFEVGFVQDAYGNGSIFFSNGKTGGYEASIGVNLFGIPNSNFSLSDFEGLSMSVNASTPWFISVGTITDHRPGAVKDYNNNNYGGIKLGVGLGAGASISHTKTTFFQMPKREFNPNIPIYYQRGYK